MLRLAVVVVAVAFGAQCVQRAQPDGPGGQGGEPTALWHDATARLLPVTAEWSHRVEAADLDGDGDVDLLFANGGDYSTPGTPELNRVFLNPGDGGVFVEATNGIFGSRPDFARAIKVRDLNRDGLADIIVACAYQTPSRLFLGQGDGIFEEKTSTLLPQPGPDTSRSSFSFGDVEVGDVDGDGDLDLVFADWGSGDAMKNDGGTPVLWINQLMETGRPSFVDATGERLPEMKFAFSWDIELFDVDGDFDLDLLVSCKRCGGGALFRGSGDGFFELVPGALPAYTNNYDYAGMDLNGDGAIDLVTVNDGDIVGASYSRREHVLINRPAQADGRTQRFLDRTSSLWPALSNTGEDDNAVVFLDYDSDGDSDFLLASLTGPDRLLMNDGEGALTLASDVFTGPATPGTLGIALADLDGDDRLDVVMAQGEHETAVEERIFLGVGLEPDTAAPVVGSPSLEQSGVQRRVRVRVHDGKSPVQREDFRAVALRFPEREPVALQWYGGQLWRSGWLAQRQFEGSSVCAMDRAGNEQCIALPSVH